MTCEYFPEYFVVAEINEAGLAVRFLQPADLAGFWTDDADFADQFDEYSIAQAVACDWQDFLRLKGRGHPPLKEHAITSFAVTDYLATGFVQLGSTTRSAEPSLAVSENSHDQTLGVDLVISCEVFGQIIHIWERFSSPQSIPERLRQIGESRGMIGIILQNVTELQTGVRNLDQLVWNFMRCCQLAPAPR